MQIHTLDPLLDPRWDDLVKSHPRASVFHEKGWLRALAKTYGYRPEVLTSTPPGKSISNGIAFCEVRSWITGARLVSLPFADHTEPLVDRADDKLQLQEWVKVACSREKWKYVELRPISWEADSGSPLATSQSFWLHTLDLTPSLDQLFGQLHKNCIQRRIRHAEREHLGYERGRSDEFLRVFYKLHMVTRRRHRLLPQPRLWFQNLISEMGPSAEIRLARKDGVPIAAIFSLRHRSTVVYKYGCSDERYHPLAGMPFLLGRMIAESKSEGAEQIDFGRTDMEDRGLVEFKDRLGTTRTKISYQRYPPSERAVCALSSHMEAFRNLLPPLPGVVSSGMGRLVYRHIA